MSKKFEIKGGAIPVIMSVIKREEKPKTRRKGGTIKNFKSGTLNTNWSAISLGIETLNKITREAFGMWEKQLLAGNKDVSRVQKEVFTFRQVIDDFIKSLAIRAGEEAEIQRRIEALKDHSQITQAARDGVIIKKEKRIEKKGDKEEKVFFDTSMSPDEVISILEKYERQLEHLQRERLSTVIGIGLGVAGILGTLGKEKETKKEKWNIVGVGTTAMAGIKLLEGILKQGERKEQGRLIDLQERMSDELLRHEQISSKATDDAIGNIERVSDDERRVVTRIANRKLLFDVAGDLVVAIISGAYINKQVKRSENGKIDGKTLATALISLQATKEVSRNFLHAIQGIQDSAKVEAKFAETCARVREILKQMDEKVYPLEGAKHAFDSIQIRDVTGRFYPKTDYQTGEVKFETIIKIPEFSMKRGEVVLLSGESGTGKSTFLRLLKRGDINNRQCIELDNGENVDNLGNEYISFRPSINLGDESSVLTQITGKKNISELDEEEKENLIRILTEMNFDPTDLLEKLARKKFMEFSTGQQRRLALSKLFYRIDDGTSVIIVDEPVGNVEDRLIREQLEMIKKYAQSKNVMLLLTTHRLDLAEDLATKRYHINANRVLEQVPVKGKKEEEREE